jgi:hypothetical protein
MGATRSTRAVSGSSPQGYVSVKTQSILLGAVRTQEFSLAKTLRQPYDHDGASSPGHMRAGHPGAATVLAALLRSSPAPADPQPLGCHTQ